MLKAWTTAFDPTGIGAVDRDAFVKQCLVAGFRGNAKKLFKLLQDNSQGDVKYLSMREFDVKAYKAHQRDDVEMVTEAKKVAAEPLSRNFQERQDDIFSLRWKKTVSAKTRADYATWSEDTRQADVACNSLDGVKAFLRRKYGCLATAWKVALDPLRTGQISKEEFCKAFRVIGYRGDIKELWNDLAQTNPNYITLHDFDPIAAHAMWAFWEFLLRSYGTLVLAWQGLDRRRIGRLEESEFCERLQELGFEGDAHQLFCMLRSGPHKTFITLSDIDLGSARAYYRQDHLATTLHGTKGGPTTSPMKWCAKAGPLGLEVQPPRPRSRQGPADGQEPPQRLAAGEATLEEPTSGEANADVAAVAEALACGFAADRTEPSAAAEAVPPVAAAYSAYPGPPGTIASDTRISEWSRELGRRQRQAVQEISKERWEATRAIKGLVEFRKALVDRFRTSLAAWRTVLDPGLLNYVTMSVFLLSLDRLGGLNTRLKCLWSEIDVDGRGHFTFQDFDPAADQDITDFRRALLDKFESLEDAWKMCVAAGNTERVDKDTFVRRCWMQLPSGWSKTRVEHIFGLLLPEPLVGRNVLIAEDFELLLLNVPVKDRAALRVTPPKPAASRGLVKQPTVGNLGVQVLKTKLCGGSHNEIPAVAVADLHKILRCHFGSVYSGWVRYLDVTETGRLPEGEFGQRAKAIGIVGNVHNLFQIMDRTGKGYITLQDLDAEVHHAVSLFFERAAEKFSSLSECWRQFDLDGKGYVNREDFIDGCSFMDYPGEAARLFDMLRPEKDRFMLYLEDLGPHGRREHRTNRSQTTQMCKNGHMLKIYIRPLYETAKVKFTASEDPDRTSDEEAKVTRVAQTTRCDGCGRDGIKHPEPTFQCEECNYHLCLPCFKCVKPKRQRPRASPSKTRLSLAEAAHRSPGHMSGHASGKASPGRDRTQSRSPGSPPRSAGDERLCGGVGFPSPPPFWHAAEEVEGSCGSSYAPSEASEAD